MKEFFEAFGVEKRYTHIGFDRPMKREELTEDMLECFHSEYFEITAEKILKLEELIGNFQLFNFRELGINYLTTVRYDLNTIKGEGKTRVDALLDLFIKLYGHLTKSEIQQVKEIVEGK